MNSPLFQNWRLNSSSLNVLLLLFGMGPGVISPIDPLSRDALHPSCPPFVHFPSRHYIPLFGRQILTTYCGMITDQSSPLSKSRLVCTPYSESFRSSSTLFLPPEDYKDRPSILISPPNHPIHLLSSFSLFLARRC